MMSESIVDMYGDWCNQGICVMESDKTPVAFSIARCSCRGRRPNHVSYGMDMFTAGYEKIAHRISWHLRMIPGRVGLICALDFDSLNFYDRGLDILRHRSLCIWIRLGLGVWIWLGGVVFGNLGILGVCKSALLVYRTC